MKPTKEMIERAYQEGRGMGRTGAERMVAAAVADLHEPPFELTRAEEQAMGDLLGCPKDCAAFTVASALDRATKTLAVAQAPEQPAKREITREDASRVLDAYHECEYSEANPAHVGEMRAALESVFVAAPPVPEWDGFDKPAISVARYREIFDGAPSSTQALMQQTLFAQRVCELADALRGAAPAVPTSDGAKSAAILADLEARYCIEGDYCEPEAHPVTEMVFRLDAAATRMTARIAELEQRLVGALDRACKTLGVAQAPAPDSEWTVDDARMVWERRITIAYHRPSGPKFGTEAELLHAALVECFPRKPAQTPAPEQPAKREITDDEVRAAGDAYKRCDGSFEVSMRAALESVFDTAPAVPTSDGAKSADGCTSLGCAVTREILTDKQALLVKREKQLGEQALRIAELEAQLKAAREPLSGVLAEMYTMHSVSRMRVEMWAQCIYEVIKRFPRAEPKRETVEDVIAEMRAVGRDNAALPIEYETTKRWADRIEAARRAEKNGGGK